jgi:hypothetical protein
MRLLVESSLAWVMLNEMSVEELQACAAWGCFTD